MKIFAVVIFGAFATSLSSNVPAPSIAEHVLVSYQEVVSNDVYQVTYQSKNSDTKSQATNKALYLAARDTLDVHYEWFRLVDMRTVKDPQASSYTITLKYRMGTGYVETTENVYDARILRNFYE